MTLHYTWKAFNHLIHALLMLFAAVFSLLPAKAAYKAISVPKGENKQYCGFP